jgi:hypothetical protein
VLAPPGAELVAALMLDDLDVEVRDERLDADERRARLLVLGAC